jgi:ribonuclease PH
MRREDRGPLELRPLRISPQWLRNLPGSALVEQGHTRVLCAASIETRVPPFLKNSGRGWVTAEYAMLPGSSGRERIARERLKVNGRSSEIQRFIGRGLRAALDLGALGERTITLDADVLQADGGTRCAALNGCLVALALALKHLVFEQIIPDFPAFQPVAAVSLGVTKGELLVDLDYGEDSSCDMDANVISDAGGSVVELQATSERRSVPPPLLYRLIDQALEANRSIIAIQKKVLQEAGFVL